VGVKHPSATKHRLEVAGIRLRSCLTRPAEELFPRSRLTNSVQDGCLRKSSDGLQTAGRRTSVRVRRRLRAAATR